MALFGLLAGCAGPGAYTKASLTDLQETVEIIEVPFFPQERYQCGPAALATVLNWSGAVVAPEDLVDEVYLPARHGSLQLEMLAASRRHERVPYVLAPDPHAVFTEVQAGYPVLVLLNLGFSWYPVWHYAVVVGFDTEQQEVMLRSGIERQQLMTFSLFDRAWSSSGRWAVVVLPPELLPETAHELPYINAVLPFEQMNAWHVAGTAYASALRRWPDSVAAGMGLGNSYLARHDYRSAEQAYRAIVAKQPRYAPALNNLAEALLQSGDIEEAERYAREAVAAGEGDARYAATLEEIRAHLPMR